MGESIRELIGGLVGLRVIGITQHDELDYLTGETEAFFCLHFSDGSHVKVEVTDSSSVSCLLTDDALAACERPG